LLSHAISLNEAALETSELRAKAHNAKLCAYFMIPGIPLRAASQIPVYEARENLSQDLHINALTTSFVLQPTSMKSSF
jgi:hypothetical protein